MPFLCLMQQQFDEEGVYKILDVDKILKATIFVQMNMIRDPSNPILSQRDHVPPIVILAQFEGLLILIAHVDWMDTEVDYAEVDINLEMGKNITT